ncbi:MAG: alpha-L-fucosidase [Clostridiales bacterium]|nr:alpha-L-fucosidase [Clostridiales bacterium]
MHERFSRSEWFRRARFGMFIHWGLYAIPARGEWVRSVERIPLEDYEPYFNEFNPTQYDPRAWARLAKAAGMKYAVMTAKHHDGFCLFDSQLTDYKATNTPAGRDLIREYLDAFRAEGLKVGLYYSIIDWHHPAYPACDDRNHPMRGNPDYKDRAPFSEYLTYMHGQVKELCTNYGKLDIMWFDFSYGDMTGETWEATKLVRMIRSYQPDVLIDNRLEVSGAGFGSIATEHPLEYSGDFASPEQIIPPQGLRNNVGEPIPWEACVTLNDHWGYAAADFNYKSAKMVVMKLVECVSKGGNLLLNVGPNARGVIPPESVDILTEVGRWMKYSGEGIYGCDACSLPKPEWGRYTQCGNVIYAHVFDVPVGPLALIGIPGERVVSVRLLRGGSELALMSDWRTDNYPDTCYVNIHPLAAYDDKDTVVKITLKA